MDTFVLVATTANGVEKCSLSDFLAENPGHDFVRPEFFIEYLKDLGEDETVAAIFDGNVDPGVIAKIEEEYGVH